MTNDTRECRDRAAAFMTALQALMEQHGVAAMTSEELDDNSGRHRVSVEFGGAMNEGPGLVDTFYGHFNFTWVESARSYSGRSVGNMNFWQP